MFRKLPLVLPLALVLLDPASGETEPTQELKIGSFSFPGRFLDGAPPLPGPPAPRLVFEQADVLSTRTEHLDGRNVVIREIRPLDLPPIPEPPPPPDPDDPEIQRATGALEDSGRETLLLFLGATVYTSSAFPGETRTLLRVWNHRTGKSFQCWSAAPWQQIAGAFPAFDGPLNRQYAMMMGWNRVDLDRWREIHALRGVDFQAPAIPEFAAGDRSSFVLLPGEENPDPDVLAPLQAIHDLCKEPAALEELRLAWEGRERARESLEAARRAALEEKKDIILNTWRIGGAPVDAPTPAAR